MVKIVSGSLLDSQAQTLVNTVNCVGVMGKGVALEFKKRFPDMYRDYLGRCQRGEVTPGCPYLYATLLPPWILNFPTKHHWRSRSELSYIVTGLTWIVDHWAELGITSLALPALGCGNGHLQWSVVAPLIQHYLDELPIRVELYAPLGGPGISKALPCGEGEGQDMAADRAGSAGGDQ